MKKNRNEAMGLIFILFVLHSHWLYCRTWVNTDLKWKKNIYKNVRSEKNVLYNIFWISICVYCFKLYEEKYINGTLMYILNILETN